MDESNKQTRKKGFVCLYENQPTIYNKVNNNSTAIIYFI